MTSAAVTQSGGSIMNLALQKTDVRTDGSGDGFTKVMDDVSKSRTQEQVSGKDRNSFGTSDQTTMQDRVKEPGRKSEVNEQGNVEEKQDDIYDTSKGKDIRDEQRVADQQEDETEKTGAEAAGTQMYQELISQATALMEQVADSFSVGTQDVMDAMEQLNMNLTDLLDPENMKALALAVAGEDQAALLTDENLYQTVQELMQLTAGTADELKQTFNISEDAWNGLLEEAANVLNAKNTNNDPVNADGQHPVLEETEEAAMQPADESGKTQKNSQKAQNGSADQEAAAQKKEQQPTVTSYETEEASGEMHEDAYAGNNGQPNFADSMQNQVNELFENPVQGEKTQGNVDVEQIMKQVLDQIKTRNNDQISEIEMQLHPASLGNLHISVASKNGVVTAQFAAQNEAVKEALEGQVMILKENLEQQGVRVEAVEVTVASHEFERNLEQEAGQEEQEAQNAEGKKKGIRRINLNGPEEEMDETDDADRITRDMMMRHGSSLDYLA